MSADRDQTKGSRQGIILAGLAILIVAALVGGFVVLNPPQGSGKAKRPGEETSHTAQDPCDPASDQDEREARKPGALGASEGLKPESGGKSNPDGTQISGSTPGPAGSATADGSTVNIDPEEINAPGKGYLIIRVADKSDDRPLPGASVYFPMRETNLESEGGEIKMKPGMADAVKRTNKFGVAVWKDGELEILARFPLEDRPINELFKKERVRSSSVVVTAPGYADLFETVSVPAASAEGAEVALKLSSAVRISGKARMKRGGNAANVKIEIKQSSRQGSNAAPTNGFSVTTDSLGEFQLKIANDYLYQFVVKQSGYAPYQSQVFDFKRDEREVSILLEPAFGVEGRVVDKSGGGIAGATVASVMENMSVETDSEGKFVFDLVKDRVYSNDVALRVTAKGYAPLTRTVLANDRSVRIELAKEGTLSGSVVDEKGKPVVPAQVSCKYFEGKEEIFSANANVDAEGNFRFAGFGTGTARLIASTAEGLGSDAVSVDVRPETDSGPVALKLTTAAAVTGRVSVKGGAPLRGVTISLDGKNATSTGEEGEFSLPGLEPGEHTVKVVNQFPISDPSIKQLPVFTLDGKAFYYLPTERKFKLKLGASQQVDFECEVFEAKFDRTIKIRVVTIPAETTTGVNVTVKPLFGTPPAGIQMPQPYSFSLDLPNGSFESETKLLNGVSYEVTFVHPRYFTATLSPQSLNEVKDGETIEVKLERAFMIKGYVKDGEGNGVEGVGLSRDASNKWNQTATTDIHGYFEFGQLKEGDYVISAFKNSYYLEQKNVKIEGRDPDLVQIQIVGANEIRIIVMNNGQPQPGAGVHVYRNENDSSNPDDWKVHFDIGTTDANGVKVISFHWVRNYQVIALHGSRIGYVNFDNLREQPMREFSLQLEASYQLSGQVVDSLTGSPVPEAFVRAHIEPIGVEGKDGNLFQTQSDSAGNFSITVPSGMYHFYVPQTLLYNRLDTTGNPVPQGTTGVSLAVELRSDIQGNYAQMVSFNTPANMTAGQTYDVSVTVRNAGSTTWTAAGSQPWRLGSQSPQDGNTWGLARVNIADGTEVSPGQSYTFTFTVTAPAQPASYNMQWRMVQENVQWFGQYSPIRQITVAAASGG